MSDLSWSTALRWLLSRSPSVYRRVDWMPPGMRVLNLDRVWFYGPHWMVNLWWIQLS